MTRSRTLSAMPVNRTGAGTARALGKEKPWPATVLAVTRCPRHPNRRRRHPDGGTFPQWPRGGLLLVMCAALSLSGCASMSPQECLIAHWDEQGYKDGRDGYAATRIMAHRKACAEVAVVPDAGRYRQGWDQGVREYCTPANGLAQGRAGRSYRNVCPAELEGSFVRAHQLGMDVYQAQHRVDDLDRSASRIQRQLHAEKDRGKRHGLRRDLNHTESQLRAAQRELARAKQRLR